MVYTASWDEFVDQTVELFRTDLESTRYVIKYRYCNCKLVLKVTDNEELMDCYMCREIVVPTTRQCRSYWPWTVDDDPRRARVLIASLAIFPP